MLNKNFIEAKIKLIHEELSRMDKFSAYTFDEITADYVKMAALERFLERAIMRAIDINQHVISKLARGDERLRGYEDTFTILSGLGVYPEEFGKKIAPSAGLRNRLVHEYDKLDEKIVYRSVGEALDLYTKYCNYVLKFLEKNKNNKK